MESFFQGWVARMEELLSDLIAATRDNPEVLSSLATTVLTHCHDYYQKKSHLTSTNVLAVLSPAWLTPCERAFLWIAGWKPDLAFLLLATAVTLSSEQQREVEEMKRATAVVEREMDEKMARVQEAMAKLRGRREAEAVVGTLEELVRSADGLRMRTVVGLVEILNLEQAVDFLAAGDATPPPPPWVERAPACHLLRVQRCGFS